MPVRPSLPGPWEDQWKVTKTPLAKPMCPIKSNPFTEVIAALNLLAKKILIIKCYLLYLLKL